MMRYSATLLTLVTFALATCSVAHADKWTVLEKDLDDFAMEIAKTSPLESQFVDEYDGGGGVLDSCFMCRPAAYLVYFQQGGGWTATDELYWDSENERYEVTWDEDLMTEVDGVRTYWRTTSASCCDFCDWDDWKAKYRNTAGTHTWEDVTYDQDCGYIVDSDDIWYKGDERSFYNDYDFDLTTNWRVSKFNREYTSTDSKVVITTGPE